jgi:hypothetical protein
VDIERVSSQAGKAHVLQAQLDEVLIGHFFDNILSMSETGWYAKTVYSS